MTAGNRLYSVLCLYSTKLPDYDFVRLHDRNFVGSLRGDPLGLLHSPCVTVVVLCKVAACKSEKDSYSYDVAEQTAGNL